MGLLLFILIGSAKAMAYWVFLTVWVGKFPRREGNLNWSVPLPSCYAIGRVLLGIPAFFLSEKIYRHFVVLLGPDTRETALLYPSHPSWLATVEHFPGSFLAWLVILFLIRKRQVNRESPYFLFQDSLIGAGLSSVLSSLFGLVFSDISFC